MLISVFIPIIPEGPNLNEESKSHDHSKTARDPVCGMTVDKDTALKAKLGDRTYYFCSQSCVDVYTQPERELKAMKRRVTLTLIGVLAALGLRVIALFGIVGTVMYLQIAGGLSVYGLAIFLVSTPIVWVAGFSIYKGAYFSLRNRKINMDVLVTVGVLAGWLYGAMTAFFPEIAFSAGAAEFGYLEVAVAILAFVLLGKYIEETIRRKSAASIRKLLELQPTTATVIRDGKETQIPAEELSWAHNHRKPGEKSQPTYYLGYSSVDEKLCRRKHPRRENRKRSYPGTINKTGFRFKATKVGEETALSQDIHLVEEAQSSIAPVQKL
jgi:Cu+-exporting ATPase